MKGLRKQNYISDEIQSSSIDAYRITEYSYFSYFSINIYCSIIEILADTLLYEKVLYVSSTIYFMYSVFTYFVQNNAEPLIPKAAFFSHHCVVEAMKGADQQLSVCMCLALINTLQFPNVFKGLQYGWLFSCHNWRQW